MKRRFFLKSIAAGAYAFTHLPLLQAALPKMKITGVRAYASPNPNPLFNQADTVVTIETDAGALPPAGLMGDHGIIDGALPHANQAVRLRRRHVPGVR